MNQSRAKNRNPYFSVNDAYEAHITKTEPKRPCWGGTCGVKENYQIAPPGTFESNCNLPNEQFSIYASVRPPYNRNPQVYYESVT